MTLEQAAPGWMHDFAGGEDLDWDAVYADQAPRVYNYFRFRLGRDADVEDLTARTFERAWRSRAKYNRDLAGFSTWLFKIAQNIRIDFLQSRRGQLLAIDAALDVAAEQHRRSRNRTSGSRPGTQQTLRRLCIDSVRDLPRTGRSHGREANRKPVHDTPQGWPLYYSD